MSPNDAKNQPYAEQAPWAVLAPAAVLAMLRALAVAAAGGVRVPRLRRRASAHPGEPKDHPRGAAQKVINDAWAAVEATRRCSTSPSG